MRINSIRARLILLNVAVITLTLIAAGLGLRHVTAVRLSGRLDDSLTTRAHRIAAWWPAVRTPETLKKIRTMRDRRGRAVFEQTRLSLIESDGRLPSPQELAGDSESFPTFSSESEQHRPRLYPPRLLGPDGRALLSGNTVPPWDPEAARYVFATGKPIFTNVTYGGDPLRVYTIFLRPEGRAAEGILQVATSRATTFSEVEDITQVLLVLAPAALLLAGVGAAFLVRFSLSPVRAITAAAAEIEARDLSARLPVTGGDEFARLAHTFNGMLERLQSAFSALEGAIERQRRFTADASHELKTPLAIARMGVGLALARERPAAEYRKALSTVDTSLDRMTHLVSDLLLLSAADNERAPFSPETVPLTPLLEEAAAPYRDLTSAPPIHIQSEDGKSPLAVQGDPLHLRHVFQNLLDNAVRHTPPSGNIAVTATITEGGNTVAIRVSDTGEGISAEHLPYLFDRFYRADLGRARVHGGTGLGLSICRDLVTLHGGTITLSSTPGAGTQVTVVLLRAA